MRKFWRKLGSFLWWTYPRGSLEYDIMVGLILAFIFLTPSRFFHDHPRPFPAHPVAITLLSAAHGHVYEMLGAKPGADLAAALRRELGHAVQIRAVKLVRVPGSNDVIYNIWTN